MRLLNTRTLEFEEFFDVKIPPYSILSHRWGEDEVSYSEYLERKTRIKSRKGYDKIMRFCKLSASRGYEYAWVDTCCIDKRSSAELSEAINAMYKWYREAVICFTYLSDVGKDEEFESSQWFTRGWTLQELLAPERMEFLDLKWNVLFSRDSVASRIAAVTNIHIEAILGSGQLVRNNFVRTRSIAQKMAWASRRVTSRAEDAAYCLLGLFDVNMSLLYGEGELSAFRRLQLEIMAKSDDETIFAWSREANDWLGTTMLASSPACFTDCHQVIHLGFNDRGYKALSQRKPYRITNKGLYMQIHVVTAPNQGLVHDLYFPIRCTIKKDTRTQPRYPMVIKISKESLKWGDLYYYKAAMCELITEEEDTSVAAQLEHLEECPMMKIYLRI